MRRVMVAVSLAAALASVVPSSATETTDVWRDVTFTAPVPCSMACPYWLDSANIDLDGDEEEDVWFQSCASPDGTGGTLDPVPGVHQPGVSYDDVVVGPAPAGSQVLIAHGRPTVDWDLVICSVDGREEAWCGYCIPDCEESLPVAIACSERVVTTALPGRSYILRAYNWSDPMPFHVQYCFSSAGRCQEAA